jgi:hypothetical protein
MKNIGSLRTMIGSATRSGSTFIHQTHNRYIPNGDTTTPLATAATTTIPTYQVKTTTNTTITKHCTITTVAVVQSEGGFVISPMHVNAQSKNFDMGNAEVRKRTRTGNHHGKCKDDKFAAFKSNFAATINDDTEEFETYRFSCHIFHVAPTVD